MNVKTKTMILPVLGALLMAYGEESVEKPNLNPTVAVVASASVESLSLDLSKVWNIPQLTAVNVLYSSAGWGVMPVAEGNTVSLSLTPVTGGNSISLASGLTNDPAEGEDFQPGIFVWNMDGVSRELYELKHSVINQSGKIKSSETLYAYFSFENSDIEWSVDEINSALSDASPNGWVFTNDENAKWAPANDDLGGLISPAGKDSVVMFTMTSAGVFNYDFSIESGTCKLFVDNVEVDLSRQVVLTGRMRHEIKFVVTGGKVRLYNVNWVPVSGLFATSTGGKSARCDFVFGPRMIRNHAELLPFAYSSTNFTGLASAGAEAIAEVKVTKLAGDGEDLTAWIAAEPSQTRTLRFTPGEGSVIWNGRAGVWRADFTVYAREGGSKLHAESAIFDMRNFNAGFKLIIR